MSSTFLSQLAPKALPSVACSLLPKIEVSSNMLIFFSKKKKQKTKKPSLIVDKLHHKFRLSSIFSFCSCLHGRKPTQQIASTPRREIRMEEKRNQSTQPFVFRPSAGRQLEHTAKHCLPLLVKSFIKRSIK